MSARIAVIGTGYVGLTTGVCLAELGHTVVCADIDADKVARLSRGELPIVEDGLADLLASGLASRRLSFVVGAAAASASCEIAFLCVPTPQGDDGSADLSYIETASAEIGPVLPPGAIVVNKSTVPVGSTKAVERVIQRSDVHVVSNPEFLREGSAVRDFMHPDRVVVGADDRTAAERVASLYASLGARTIITDPASAETIKYAANAFLATKLSFVNAIAAICEGVGADIEDVIAGIGSDSRIGEAFLRPGPGWGGSCLVGEESVLIRDHEGTRLMQLAELHQRGAGDTEVLSWNGFGAQPRFQRLIAVTRRPYKGSVVKIRTKMGRRLTTTFDHPMVCRMPDGSMGIVEAGNLTTDHWLPIPLGQPTNKREEEVAGCLLGAIPESDTSCSQIHARHLPDTLPRTNHTSIRPDRFREILRGSTSSLLEAIQLRAVRPETRLATVTNGTYVPIEIPYDEVFWQVMGLYLAEGHCGRDGRRMRLQWSFHPTKEDHLVDLVSNYWRKLGVKTSVNDRSTTRSVTISSRLLATWFIHGLRLGKDAYTHRIPDQIWSADENHQRALLRGLWLGDGSWSYVNGGPSVVLEYGSVSRELIDGMVRLLQNLGIVARVKVGRTSKSSTDTYWLTISGAQQIRSASWLLEDDERQEVLNSIGRQAKETKPTGYQFDDHGRAWVRVIEAAPWDYQSDVYSVEVEGTHTVVSTFGLVTHNCFPKDSRALVKIAENAGYEFDLLSGVVTVNDQQLDRMAAKVAAAVGGSLASRTIAVWGLTFKAGTDDLRESPSIAVITRLLEAGARVIAHDPTVDAHRFGVPASVELAASPVDACRDADVLCVLTEWPLYRDVAPTDVAAVMIGRAVVDTRNLLDRSAWQAAGFTHQGVGR